MNYSKKFSRDSYGKYFFVVFLTPIKELGITIREVGIFLYAQRRDGSNYEFDVVANLVQAYDWLLERLNK